MTALLSEGQSDKAGQGPVRMAWDISRRTLPDLRYVLYAGKRGNYEIASGHTILASHRRGQIRHSAHGFWRTPTDFFSLEDGNFPTVVPEVIAGSDGPDQHFRYDHRDRRFQPFP